MYRVLKPHGKLVMSDPTCEQQMNDTLREDDRLRALCLSGSLPIAQYVKALTDVGFGTIEIRARKPYRILDPKNYPTEPAVLGLKNQALMDKLLNLLLDLLQKLSTSNVHIGDRGGTTTRIGTTFDSMSEDWDGEGEPLPNSIGELRSMLREIKSNHVFIKK